MTIQYTEAYILAAWDRIAARMHMKPWPSDRDDFLAELRSGGPVQPKEKMLFARDDLLAVAATHHDKLMVHGIFAVLDTSMANEQYIMAQAKKANLGGNMEIMIRLARARKDEDFQPGDVVRDAGGEWYRRTNDGTHPWVMFGNSGRVPDTWLKRPLEKMP